MYLYKLCGKGETDLLSILNGSDNIMLRILSFWICASKQHTRFWKLDLFLL